MSASTERVGTGPVITPMHFASAAAGSDQQRQERALRRLEKLAAVGQEASTIAHEINNPLESLTNLLYLMRMSQSMDEVHHYLGMAQQELARVTEITVQTLRFHRHAHKPGPVNLGALAQAVMTLYSGRMSLRKIEMEWRLRDTPHITCLEGEIRQVLNNLVRNALEAMGSEGKLMIRVGMGRSADGNTSGVRVTVADTGEGIHPDIKAHLFELFQTTKENTGTGVGLWVSRGILEKHGGTIRVRSRRASGSKNNGWTGGWTVFSVWLPLQADGTEHHAPVPPV